MMTRKGWRGYSLSRSCLLQSWQHRGSVPVIAFGVRSRPAVSSRLLQQLPAHLRKGSEEEE